MSANQTITKPLLPHICPAFISADFTPHFG